MPDWLDADRLQWIILIVLAVVLYAMYVVTRFIRHLVMKVIVFIVLAGFGLSLWIQRADLQDCVDTCTCSIFGQDVVIPEERRPDSCG